MERTHVRDILCQIHPTYKNFIDEIEDMGKKVTTYFHEYSFCINDLSQVKNDQIKIKTNIISINDASTIRR